jgi:hypothetical protein
MSRAWEPGFYSGHGQWRFFLLFATKSRSALGPTQPHIEWVLVMKWLGPEADQSPPSNAEIKTAWGWTTCTHAYAFISCDLVKHTDSFISITVHWCRVCHRPRGKEPASRHGGRVWIPCGRDVIWTKWHWAGSHEALRFSPVSLHSTASRMALGPTQPLIQWVPGAHSLGVKRAGREADHSPPSSAEVKECVELHFYSPSTPSWRSAQLKKSSCQECSNLYAIRGWYDGVGKFFPVLNQVPRLEDAFIALLRTTPWRRFEEWRYNLTH